MVVVIIDGEERDERRVQGRAAEMIAWLAKAVVTVNVQSVGVHFVYRGKKLKVIVETEETINTF
jgi:hypothetical protein